ncbi:uncharacterized protein LOC129612222 [Condylostylus longicornis]|uniref:uncharacterized protein LOC129612222 n=1 Tax=Condylostylus longicornis TaxID=2530218 RepID=UPI00244DC599|nr:uncharacterized protein LOC129612222 [Condylostylus longicornis]
MIKNLFYIYIVTTMITVIVGSEQQETTDSILNSAISLISTCAKQPLVLCLKERALHYFDSENGDVKLSDGIQLIKTDDIPVGRSLNEINLPDEPEARENEVDSLLVERIARFFGTHTLQFKVPRESIEDMQRSLEEGRSREKKKGKKYLLPLLLLFKLKAAALLPLAIGFLAMIAFKALVIGKIALLLSGIIGLKKLLDSKHSAQSYEVVAHPHYSHGSSYDEHSYGRSMDAQNLAYSAYTKK